jgi:CHAT domain-containing protein
MRGSIKRCVTDSLLLVLVCLPFGLQVNAQSTSDVSDAIERLAQSPNDDSAEKLLKDHPSWINAEVAAGALQKAQSLLSTDFNKSLAYAKVALRLSTKLNDNRLRVGSLYLLAFGDLRAGSFDAALTKYDECYQLGTELNDSAFAFAFVPRSADLLRGKKLVPLPETETEAKSIARIYGLNRSKVFLGRDARENTFKNLAGRYNVIHIAAHGFLDDSNPLYSYLVAQGKFNQDEDGLLTAREVLSLKLNANLAVLSACDTGLSDVRTGEGMIGMTWAFFVAGVPSTVASEWSVETHSTTKLMVSFHENLTRLPKKAVVDRAEALPQAQVQLLDSETYSLPYYWAGFSLVGSPW